MVGEELEKEEKDLLKNQALSIDITFFYNAVFYGILSTQFSLTILDFKIPKTTELRVCPKTILRLH